MKPEVESLIMDYERRAELMRRYLQVAQQKMTALIDNDLPRLEQSLEDEQSLIFELSKLEPLKPARSVEAPRTDRSLTPRSSLKSLAHQIQVLNRKNLALTTNGFDFSQRMLDAICPPLTYESLHNPSAVHAVVPTESVISVKG